MPSENWDFSEQNLIDEHGYDNGPCEGEQIYMSTADLARWSGPISEEDDPFIYLSAGAAGPAKQHVQDIIYLHPGMMLLIMISSRGPCDELWSRVRDHVL